MTFFDKLLGRNKEMSASRPEIMATTGGPTPDALLLNEVPVVRTSGHPADVRTGLWEQLERAWPSASFNTMDTEEINAHRAVVLEAINGLLTPTPPRNEEPAEHIDYELALLREKILQASRFYTAQLLISIDVAGYDTTEGARRGQWVQFVHYALHVAVRAGGDHLPGVTGARMEAELIDSVLRRLAHEIPDGWALPTAVPDVYAELRDDFEKAHAIYAKMPPRWVNDTTPAAPWVLAKSCASHLTDGGAAAMDTFAPYVVQCSERIADGIEADASWARVAEQVARGA